MKPTIREIDRLIKLALEEDFAYNDITSDNLIEKGSRATAQFIAKDKGVLCGIDIALRVFTLLDSGVEIEKYINDGEKLIRGSIIAKVSGPTLTLLRGERTALNILQHLSGISTATRHAVEAVKGTDTVITDTRKTLPGLRVFQKYAVKVGGGVNHRFNLSDAVLIKDNHIDICGSIEKAVKKLRQKLGKGIVIEVETRTLADVREALESGADKILLDNMSCETLKKAVKIVGGMVPLEASGGIRANTLRSVAETGVDIISIGALTHSVKALDISFKVKI